MGRRPNILLVTTDQQRGDCLGAANSRHPVMTPHLDQLAMEGTRFDRAYSDAPLCIPARTTIMTGRCAYRHGVTTLKEERMPELPEHTLAGRLKSAGYQTHAAGKMHFYPPRNRNGFERMRLVPEDYVNWLEGTPHAGMYRGHGLGGNEVYPVYSAVPEKFTTTYWTVEESIDFLRQRDPDAPFFMWTSFEAPHPPFDPPESVARLYDDFRIPMPDRGEWADSGLTPNWVLSNQMTRKTDRLPEEVVRAARKHYYAQITWIDYQLGRLFGELQSQGLWDNTVVLFTSDHGDMLGDHGLFHKSCYYEPSAHVPFLLRLPASWDRGFSPGTVSTTPVQLADIFPTLLDAAGCLEEADRTERDGISLIGSDFPMIEQRWLFGFLSGHHGTYMATDGRWKYIYYVWGAQEQLFDLADDPGECRNLAGEAAFRSIAEQCRAKLLLEIPELAARGETAAMQEVHAPLPDCAQLRKKNTFAWRGPIRYGGHW